MGRCTGLFETGPKRGYSNKAGRKDASDLSRRRKGVRQSDYAGLSVDLLLTANSHENERRDDGVRGRPTEKCNGDHEGPGKRPTAEPLRPGEGLQRRRFIHAES